MHTLDILHRESVDDDWAVMRVPAESVAELVDSMLDLWRDCKLDLYGAMDFLIEEGVQVNHTDGDIDEDTPESVVAEYAGIIRNVLEQEPQKYRVFLSFLSGAVIVPEPMDVPWPA